MLCLRALLAALTAFLLLIPATVAVPLAAAQNQAPPAQQQTRTVKDPYGERKQLDLPAGEGETKPGTTGGSLVRTVIGLGVVIAVIYGLTWVLRQMKAAKSEERGFGGVLSSEASVMLAPGRAIHLVRAGSEYVLVGSSEKGVTPIKSYTEAEAHELGLLDDDIDRDDNAGDRRGDRDRRAPAPVNPIIQKLRDRTLR